MGNALFTFALSILKIFFWVIAILILIAGILALLRKFKGTDKPTCKIKNLNDYYDELKKQLQDEILEKADKKKIKKTKKAEAQKSKLMKEACRRIFVLKFEGDWKASATTALREEITAILQIATPQDEVVLCLESTGGVVHGYGLAASLLQRFKDKKIPLTIAVDKVAASGGYMMACVADRILAAPFAIIGSIGVIAQLPNFHKLLKKHDIDFEQIMAGEYKRTLTLFGENTTQGRKKFQEEVDEAHRLFKEFIQTNRPQVDIEKVSTGEYWFAKRAIEFKLVDDIITSDDYLLKQSDKTPIFEISITPKKKFFEKFSLGAQKVVQKLMASFKQSTPDEETYL